MAANGVAEEEKINKACTREYMPVCGNDGETYSNGCTACASRNINSYEEGACENTAEEIPPEAIECVGEPPEMCTMEYIPVCGNDGITYGNACGACGAGVAWHIPGECLTDEAPIDAHFCEPSDGPRICTADYSPVCGDDGETHSNGCTACSAGVNWYVDGACE